MFEKGSGFTLKIGCLRIIRPTTFTLLLILIGLMASLRPQRNSATPKVNIQAAAATVVLFAISGEANNYQMDAVTIISGKQFTAPFTDEQKDKQKTFAERYFAAGRKYRLMFGGGDAGTVSVKKWSEGCNSVHADVTTTTTAHLGGQVKALATNSESIGKRASTRRAPNYTERADIEYLVRDIYTRNGTPRSLLDSIKVTNLTATDLNGDGNYEMIGSFTLETKTKLRRDLFLIARPTPPAQLIHGNFIADFVKFQTYKLPPEGFASSIDYVDQLDTDGDGIGEVVAVQGGFDAYGYVIFKKVAGRWGQVYQGIGDAC